MPSASISDDGDGQALGAPERAQADAHVLPERAGRLEPAAGRQTAPHRLARQRDVAEFPQRRQARRLGVLAALDPLLDAEGQVAADLVVERRARRAACATPRPPAPGS